MNVSAKEAELAQPGYIEDLFKEEALWNRDRTYKNQALGTSPRA